MVFDPKEMDNPQVTEHADTATVAETWVCEQCTLSFTNLDEWKQHQSAEHIEESDKAETMVGLQI